MAITETFRSVLYDPAKLDGRFVQLTRDGQFYWIECLTVGKAGIRVDARGGFGEREDFPESVALAAEERRHAGVWPFYVEWPA